VPALSDEKWLAPVPGAPPWVPTIDDEVSVRRLRRAIYAVLVLGVVAFIARGANRPADPQLADASTARIPVPGLTETGIAFVDPSGAIVERCVLSADSPAQQQQGLRGVTELVGYAGVLFRFPAPVQAEVAPPEGAMPLSAAFFDQAGSLIHAADLLPAGPPVGSPLPYSFVLQVPQGGLEAAGVDLGSRLEVRGPCPPP
jgi:uncharacterized membrane protein (UPF0127 family)